jgi:transposase
MSARLAAAFTTCQMALGVMLSPQISRRLSGTPVMLNLRLNANSALTLRVAPIVSSASRLWRANSWFIASSLALNDCLACLFGAKSMPLPKTRDLTDNQWATLDNLIPEPTIRKDGRGRPWKDRRAVLNGILWVLRTGAPRGDVPERYPSYQTCHRRFQQWVRSGVMRGILEALASNLKLRGSLDVEEAFIDGSFAPAKKGDPKSAKQNGAREPRSWRLQTAMVYLLLCALKVPLLMK